MHAERITIDGVPIDLERKRVKYLRLVIYPQTGRVRLSAPLGMSEERVRSFVISKMAWIKKHQARIALRQYVPQKTFQSGESISYDGKEYLLEVIPHACETSVAVENTYVKLFIRGAYSSRQCAEVIDCWYRKKLQNEIPPLLQRWERHLGVQVHEWGIKRMKTRWGSCNIRKHRIWLNMELAKKSHQCLEYVLLHEMIHLLVPNHSSQFKESMTRWMPEWKTREKELKGIR